MTHDRTRAEAHDEQQVADLPAPPPSEAQAGEAKGGSKHTGGVNVLMGDGSVRQLDGAILVVSALD